MHLSSKHYITTFLRAENEHRQILSDLVSKIQLFLLTHRHPRNSNIDGSTSCHSGGGEVEAGGGGREGVPSTAPSKNILLNSPSSSTTTITTITTSDPIFRIYLCIERIFHNGLRIFKQDNTPDCWRFIEGLNWLNPQMTISIANQLIRSSIIHIPYNRIRNDKALAWIYECLETKTLSSKLKYLLSDREHLENCYEITAYLHSKRYVNALFICLNAIELEQQDFLSEIDQSLYEIRGEIGFTGSGTGYIGIGSDEDEFRCNTIPSLVLHQNFYHEEDDRDNSRNSGGGGSADSSSCKNNNNTNSSHNNIKGHKRATSHPNVSGAISCFSVIDQNSSLRKMGNSKSLQFSYDDSPDSSRRSSFAGGASSPIPGTSTDELIPLTTTTTITRRVKRHDLYGRGEFNSPKLGPQCSTGSNSSTRKQQQAQQRRHSSRNRIKCKHLISQKLRPWTSLPDIRLSISNKAKFKQIVRSRSQTLRTDKSRIRLTAENLAFKECYETPCKSKTNLTTMMKIKSMGHLKINNIDAINSDNLDLTPINLVKCDDIKIHLDRKQINTQRDESNSINPLPSIETSTATPGTSPSVTKSGGQFSDFWRNIPGKRNIFFSSIRPTAESSGSMPDKQTNSAPGDFVNTFLPRIGEKIENRYSHKVLQDVVTDTATPLIITQRMPSATITTATTANGTPPQPNKIQPTPGQTLINYLEKLQMCRTNVTDLERENAHFDLSDAIISAIEQAKCLHRERLKEKRQKAARRAQKFATEPVRTMNNSNGTPSSTMHHPQHHHTRPRRLKNWVQSNDKQQQQPSQSNEPILINLSESETSLSSTSFSSVSSDSDLSHASANSISSSNSAVAGDLKYLQIFSVSSHSINDHAAYAEWAENSFESYSAEGIALSLISKLKDKQLPSASDILMDNPSSGSLSNDPFHPDSDPYGMRQLTCTRGTADWAPPRPQIIFTRHPNPDRKRLLQSQNYKCAGCGQQVAIHLSHYFRFCEYLGKYHCTGCHRNQITAIPARILDRWDFSCHQVSVFAYRLLDEIWKLPLFRVPDLNKELYEKVRALRTARLRRTQLKYINDFVRLCRFADDAHKIITDKCPAHYVDDIDLWSMHDLVAVRSGTFSKDVQDIIVECEEHIFNCELCTARGFLCEYCPQKQVIFPWQTKVHRCDCCGACAHSTCWKVDADCLKCQRLQQRNKKDNSR